MVGCKRGEASTSRVPPLHFYLTVNKPVRRHFLISVSPRFRQKFQNTEFTLLFARNDKLNDVNSLCKPAISRSCISLYNLLY